jgi:hypothetical protein
MNAYVVRKSENNEFVGIFVAGSINELAYLTDQCCDTHLCQYAPLGAGGIMAPENNAPPIPAPPCIDEDDTWGRAFLASLEIDEVWNERLTEGALRWKSLPAFEFPT